jgi:hypothetical protein
METVGLDVRRGRSSDEQLRQATFLGWRDDKKPEEVVLEKPNADARFS